MRTPYSLTIALGLLSLAACQAAPSPEDYANRGDPERLLTKSAEIVHIDLGTADAIDMLADNIHRERPARAVLNCRADAPACKKATRVLAKAMIPAESTASGNDVTLMYDRILARDCEQRYVDNSSNPYNLNMPSFGCSMTGNTVQMVTDKRQFTDPGLLSFMDGGKAAQVYDNYSKPPAAEAGGTGSSSVVNSGSSASTQ